MFIFWIVTSLIKEKNVNRKHEREKKRNKKLCANANKKKAEKEMKLVPTCLRNSIVLTLSIIISSLSVKKVAILNGVQSNKDVIEKSISCLKKKN